MSKTILITGSTDGIGLAAAEMLLSMGHQVLLHGRNPEKLEKTQHSLAKLPSGGRVEGYIADLSHLHEVAALAQAVAEQHTKLDVLINNAGVFTSAETRTQDGLDVRFAVNTLAPYLLTQKLLPLLGASGRVINLSSAAQSPVDPDALAGRVQLVRRLQRLCSKQTGTHDVVARTGAIARRQRARRSSQSTRGRCSARRW